MKVHLSRWVCLDVEANLRRLLAEAGAAVAAGARLVVFPELFLTGYARSLDPAAAREVFAEISGSAPGILFVFGSISEGDSNRCPAWLDGREITTYDKVHLFRPNREHTTWRPGARYVALEWEGLSLGLMLCNDVRFPEQARALRLEAGCDLLVVPAWWPWRRAHLWETLLQARAAENGVWVLGCCVAASVDPREEFAGAGNHVFDPSGEPVSTADDRIYELDLERPPTLLVDTAAEHRAVDDVEVARSAPPERDV